MSEHAGKQARDHQPQGAVQARATAAPGKQTLVDQLSAVPVQRRASGDAEANVHAAAERGVATPASALPFQGSIQRAFGRHDISSIQAHTGPEAAASARDMGADAYATRDHVVLGGGTDLHTVAHEAAHVVQQRGGVQLKGGVGQVGDTYERHADEVADAVVAGRSAESLLDRGSQIAGGGAPDGSAGGAGVLPRGIDRHAGGGGGGGAQAVQRHNHAAAPEDAAITAIHAGAGTPQDKLNALIASPAPELQYGIAARTDEETEVTAGASYLQKKKTDWRAELASRQAGNAPQWQPHENFQYEMDQATPGEQRNQEPWFMDPGHGYQVTGGNQARLANIANERNNPAADDPQQQLGMSYQRDTMFTLASAAMDAHKAQLTAGSTAAEVQGHVNKVLRVKAGADELRLQITGAADNAGNVDITGNVLAAQGVNNAGLAGGTAVRLVKDTGAGSLAIHAGAGPALHTLAAGGWRGEIEDYAFYQSRTRINDGLGMNHPQWNNPAARNRGAQPPLDDARFDEVAERYERPMAPERGYGQTLGPERTSMNFNDVGWDVRVAPYRRLGGDSIFREADHPHPAPYQNQLQPAGAVDVNQPDWYYNQANANPDRFVGGRSNSTALYMSSATMLYHSGRLSLADAGDVLAFVIADMVVSGEHSMPECMTTVVMAAGSAEPWTMTPVNLAAPADTLSVWLRLVNDPTRTGMRADARARLLTLLSNPDQDPKLIKVLTMLLKALP